MVRPGARRDNDELCFVIDRTGRVEDRVVTASSHGVRRCQIPVDSSYSNADYGATDCGNPSFDTRLGRDSGTSGDGDRTQLTDSFISVMSKIAGSQQIIPEKSRPLTNPTQRKKAKNDGWEQIGPADGGPLDPVLIPSYCGYIAGSIWCGQSDLCIADSSVSINGQDLAQVAESSSSRLSTELSAACYVQYLLGSSLFIDKSGNNVPGKLWLLLKNVGSVDEFAWGLDILVFSYVCPSIETRTQINWHLHSFRLDDRLRGQVDSVQFRGDN
ncbi:hypothetical protein M9H77_13897 [Catharanthus roseus]|uniref:Uncharacterized protein n=1 Tax=Catharanthus roseus TaxID=4058 RepID=A0ACC0BLM6_CATRO|nr:hypothetical protein M9H77_13897 [Catharanthus roseus]